MTEDGWLRGDDPTGMVRYMAGRRHMARSAVGRRKLRLLAVAVVRMRWPTLPDEHTRMRLEAAELAADGRLTPSDLFHFFQIWLPDNPPPVARAAQETCEQDPVAAAVRTTDLAMPHTGLDASGMRWPADLVGCIVGNPFRPVAFAPEWRTSSVVALAAGVYEDRAFDRLPVLADALADAGCDHAELLAHLRGPGPHARGCWPVDLILGRS